MKLFGLQKMTLLDFPGKVACTVFTGGCDLRCPFCHNFQLATGKSDPVMDEGEFFDFLSKRRGLMDGVAVTGGEPCLNRDLPDFLKRVKSLGFLTKLDTNGLHPDLLKKILDAGLADYVAMDVKNSPEKYALTCGVDRVDMDKIAESISLIKSSAPDYEFRTTVTSQLHDVSDIRRIGEMIEGASRYFIQPFADRDTVPFGGFSAPDRKTLGDFAAAAAPFAYQVGVRGVD